MPSLYYSDAVGRAALLPLEMPVAYTSGRGLAIEGAVGWLVNGEQPTAVVGLDLPSRRSTGEIHRDDGSCQLQDITVTNGHLIAACRNQNGLRRLNGGDGAVVQVGPSSHKALKIVGSGDWLLVLHRAQSYVSAVNAGTFDAANPGLPVVLPVPGIALDVAISGGTAYVLSDVVGVTWITAFSLPLGLPKWSVPTGVSGAVMIAVDAADDFERDLGSL
jgi:hypothetical protein